MMRRSRPAFVLEAPPLDADDVQRARVLLAECGDAYPEVQSTVFLEAAPLIAQRLPLALLEFVHYARVQERGGLLVIPARNIIGDDFPSTPTDWREVGDPSPSHAAEVFLVLVASLIGDVFGWETQQDGRYVHDVLPMRGLEDEQVGWSSRAPLTWHTEDAFHPHRADWLALLCLRNPDCVATTVCSVTELALPASVQEILWQERFLIRPDASHLPKYNTTDRQLFQRIEQMMREPARVSVLFGSKQSPFLRIDPDYMIAVPGDAAAERALRAVSECIERNLHDLVLREGDLCILDNHRVVHGRRSFQARFDGTDRWLKRTNVIRDLRRAAESRKPGSRLLV